MNIKMIERSLRPYIEESLNDKITLLTGPRQVGKTFLSKMICNKYEFLNFDESTHRKILLGKMWNRDAKLIIFDEIHKMKNWKSWLKGIYDVDGIPPQLLVTGSARLDVYRKGGDSLAGRHHLFRLHPLSVKEIDSKKPKEVTDLLMRCSGFPEPFIKGTERASKLWRKSHLDVILREDIFDLEKVRDIKSIELLIELLADRVGGPISYKSLAEDLMVSPHTIKHWLQVLENLFVIFIVRPHSKNVAKAILKEPKVYFYDIGRITNGDAAKLENLVACHLLKRAHYLADVNGERTELAYIKDKDKRQIDFVTLLNNKIEYLIEVKQSDTHLHNGLAYYHHRLSPEKSFQLVYNTDRILEPVKGIKISPLANFLAELDT
ncbi:MAG: ATP-binding protein [Pseudomonadota bacterium]